MSNFTINRVVLIGRLTRDPELRTLPSGTNVCIMRLACNSSRRDPDGEFREKPNYFDVSVYGATAESVNRHTSRGRRVAIDGRLEWREWENSDQQKRQAVSIVADTVLFLDNPGEHSENAERQDPEPSDGVGADEPHEQERELVGVGAGSGDDLVF